MSNQIPRLVAANGPLLVCPMPLPENRHHKAPQRYSIIQKLTIDDPELSTQMHEVTFEALYTLALAEDDGFAVKVEDLFKDYVELFKPGVGVKNLLPLNRLVELVTNNFKGATLDTIQLDGKTVKVLRGLKWAAATGDIDEDDVEQSDARTGTSTENLGTEKWSFEEAMGPIDSYAASKVDLPYRFQGVDEQSEAETEVEVKVEQEEDDTAIPALGAVRLCKPNPSRSQIGKEVLEQWVTWQVHGPPHNQFSLLDLARRWMIWTLTPDPQYGISEMNVFRCYTRECRSSIENFKVVSEALSLLIKTTWKGQVHTVVVDGEKHLHGLRWMSQKERFTQIRTKHPQGTQNSGESSYTLYDESTKHGARHFANVSQLDTDNSITNWICEALECDEQSSIDGLDIRWAIANKFFSTGPLGAVFARVKQEDLAGWVAHVHSLELQDCKEGEYTIHGIRWRQLKGCKMLFSASSAPDRMKAREEAEKLLHLEHPCRTRLWIKMKFQRDPECGVSRALLSCMWHQAWKPYIKPTLVEPGFDEGPFLDCLLRTFQEATRVDLDDGRYVILGISPKPDCPSGAEELIDKKNRKDYKRLVDFGAISNDPPLNKFGESLKRDPLLPIPTDAATGPFLARLRRRQQYLVRSDLEKEYRESRDYYNICAEIYLSDDFTYEQPQMPEGSSKVNIASDVAEPATKEPASSKASSKGKGKGKEINATGDVPEPATKESSDSKASSKGKGKKKARA